MLLERILIFALLPHILPSAAETCPYWRDIVLSQGFAEYVLQLTKLTALHIGLPAEFSEGDTRLFAEFLKKTPISATIFRENTDINHGHMCSDVNTELHTVLLVLCRKTVWPPVFTRVCPYHLYMYVFCAESSEHRILAHNLPQSHDKQFPPIRGSGVFNVTVGNQEVLVTEDGTVTCLNCTSNLRKGAEFKILGENLLSGNMITVFCQYPLFCEIPSMIVLEQIILNKNASFNKVPSDVFQFSYVIRKTLDDPKTLFYFPWLYNNQYLFPQLSPVKSYESLGYEFFVRKPVPLLKEVVLLLPLHLSVWLAVVVSFIVSVVIYILIARVHKVRIKLASDVSFLFLAALLQRGYPEPHQKRRLHSVRLVLGVWFLTVTVISTGYMGVLTSLLTNVPLSGELPEFTYSENPFAKGFRLCTLGYSLDNETYDPPSSESYLKLVPVCRNGSGHISVADDGKDVFMIFGSDFSNPGGLKSQLISRGYARARTDYSDVVTGPQIKSTSPYRQHLGKIVGRAFEAGLFEDQAEMWDFYWTLRGIRETERDTFSADPLGLHDLRPFFVILAAGLALSCLGLIGELLYGRRRAVYAMNFRTLPLPRGPPMAETHP